MTVSPDGDLLSVPLWILRDATGCLLTSHSNFLAKRAPDFPEMTSNKSKEGGPSASPWGGTTFG